MKFVFSLLMALMLLAGCTSSHTKTESSDPNTSVMDSDVSNPAGQSDGSDYTDESDPRLSSESNASGTENYEIHYTENIKLAELLENAQGRILLIWSERIDRYCYIYVEQNTDETEKLNAYRSSDAYHYTNENLYDCVDSRWIVYPDGFMIGMTGEIIEENAFVPDLHNVTYGGVYESAAEDAFRYSNFGRRAFLPQGLCEYVNGLIEKYKTK